MQMVKSLSLHSIVDCRMAAWSVPDGHCLVTQRTTMSGAVDHSTRAPVMLLASGGSAQFRLIMVWTAALDDSHIMAEHFFNKLLRNDANRRTFLPAGIDTA
jgi:hypothetical protein